MALFSYTTPKDRSREWEQAFLTSSAAIPSATAIRTVELLCITDTILWKQPVMF